jgi:nucleotide-binding universal stress UspA family protein
MDRILIPTDMSDFAKPALRYASMFREKLGSKLTILFADELAFPVDFGAAPVGWYFENEPASKERLVEKVRAYARDTVGQADVVVMQDTPAHAIVETAEHCDADLIIMGTHGRHGWRRALLGSVTERVLRDTDRPVLTVAPPRMGSGEPAIRRILCPVNFSEIARDALEQACYLAKAFDAELTVMHVAENEGASDLKLVEERFSQWVTPEMRTISKYREIVVHGDAAARVLEVAEEIQADLIVVGAQHKLFSDATVIGTTTELITRFARCAVLTLVRRVGATTSRLAAARVTSGE